MDRGLEPDDKIYRQGYLQKKKSVAKSVKKRWFCLNTDAFVTFRTEECTKGKGECMEILPLTDIQTVKKQHTGSHKYPFEIITRQKTHVFLTDSAYEQDQWVKAFHTAMKLRCFHTQKDQVVSKYSANGKERRSSTGTKKLSQIKRYVQDGLKPGVQRKSSSVDCDPSETEYQGIPIGNLDVNHGNDDVFDVSSTTQGQPIVTLPDDNSDNGHREQSMGDDETYQDLSSQRTLETNTYNREADEILNDETVDTKYTKDVDFDNKEKVRVPPTSLPPPVPAPSSGLSRSKKKIFPEEQIYDVPPLIDDLDDCDEEANNDTRINGEDIYDVPAREYPDDTLPESAAMSELKMLLADDDDDDEEDEYLSDMEDDDRDDVEETYEDEENNSLETTLTETGKQKSAVDDLRTLLDRLDY